MDLHLLNLHRKLELVELQNCRERKQVQGLGRCKARALVINPETAATHNISCCTQKVPTLGWTFKL